MLDSMADNFFKKIVDDANAALLFIAPSAEGSVKTKEYIVKYANHKADKFFSNSSESIEDLPLVQFTNGGEIVLLANKVLKKQDFEVFDISRIEGKN